MHCSTSGFSVFRQIINSLLHVAGLDEAYLHTEECSYNGVCAVC